MWGLGEKGTPLHLWQGCNMALGSAVWRKSLSDTAMGTFADFLRDLRSAGLPHPVSLLDLLPLPTAQSLGLLWPTPVFGSFCSPGWPTWLFFLLWQSQLTVFCGVHMYSPETQVFLHLLAVQFTSKAVILLSLLLGTVPTPASRLRLCKTLVPIIFNLQEATNFLKPLCHLLEVATFVPLSF